MISVCIATYNGEKYIEEQIFSILNQSVQVDEIIISDDNSTDKTIEILENINNHKIKILKNKKQGIKYNFQNALKNSKGDFVFLADQDDIWMINKVEKTVPLLSNYDLVVHNACLVNQNGELLENSDYFKMMNSKKGLLANLIKCRYLGCCMAFSRKVLEKSIDFAEKDIMHDIWIGLIAERIGKVYFYSEKLVKYRRHGNTVSFAGLKSKRKLIIKILDRINIIKKLYFIKKDKKEFYV
ncbi:MAG: glycosyltransferase family 2 protein [Fusobacteriaceae bacterium]